MANFAPPIPQQPAADLVSPGNFCKAGAWLFSLSNNPELILKPPTTATFDTGYDLHAQQPPLFATLLRTPLESEAVDQLKTVLGGGIRIGAILTGTKPALGATACAGSMRRRQR